MRGLLLRVLVVNIVGGVRRVVCNMGRVAVAMGMAVSMRVSMAAATVRVAVSGEEK